MEKSALCPILSPFYPDSPNDILRAGNGNAKPDSQGGLLGRVQTTATSANLLGKISGQASGPQGSSCSPCAEGSRGPESASPDPQDGPYLSPWSVSP